MSVKRRKTKLVFYLGGPRATEGDQFWVTGDSDRFPGCAIAGSMGATIPLSTFTKARPEVSAENVYCYRHDMMEGKNTTAIVPLEVDE